MLKQVATNNMEFRTITYPGIMPNKYIISEYGDVISLQPSRFTPLYRYLIPGYPPIYIVHRHVGSRGYLKVSLDTDTTLPGIAPRLYVSVHRLVAWEFCANRNISLTVDHLDGNKLNNHYSNLEWVPMKENINRAYESMAKDGGYYKSAESIRRLCQLLSAYDGSLSYMDMCSLAGLDLTKQQASALCSSIIHRDVWKDISKDYDFSNVLQRYVVMTDEYKLAVVDLLMNGLNQKQAYDIIITMPFPIIPYQKFISLCERLRRKYNIHGIR